MKKVIIMSEKMNMGGVEKALISMLESINYDNYDVTLLLTAIEGELIKKVPNQVKIITINEFKELRYKSVKKLVLDNVLKGKFMECFKIIYYILLYKFNGDLHSLYKYNCESLPKLDEKYDLAISYQAPSRLPAVFVANNINAEKKALWLHSDPSKSPCDISCYEESYSKYDKIFCVANSIKEKFIKVFPNLESKTEVFYNIIPVRDILEKSKIDEGFKDKYDGIRILTIGRLSPEKGYKRAINVCEKLINCGYKIRWYVCGEGEERNELEKIIKEKELEDNFILLGNKSNPYPYLKQCDIYVQTSFFEGYCTTTNEARVLRKPIITTDVSGAREQFINYENGIIVPIEEVEIYKAVKELIDNESLRYKLINNLKKIDFKNNNDMYKLDNI